MKFEQAVSQNTRVLDSTVRTLSIQETLPAKAGGTGESAGAGDLSISRLSKAERNALPISEQFLISSIEKANKAVMGTNTRFEFSIHKGTKEIMVKVFDEDTGDLLREIPSEKILDIVAGIWQAVGLFVDEKR